MKIEISDIHIHLHVEPDHQVLALLNAIIHRLDLLENRLMASISDFETALAAIDEKVGVVKTDVETLIAKLAAIPPGGLTPEQQAAIDAAVQHAQNIATSLGAIDTEVNPSPPTA